MAEEGQDLVCLVAPLVLRISIETVMFDRNAAGGFLRVDNSSSVEGSKYFIEGDLLNLHDEQLHLFFKPGHYDIFYSNKVV